MQGKGGVQGQGKASGGFARQGNEGPRRRRNGKARPGQMGRDVRWGMGEQANARQWRKGRPREGYKGGSKEMQGMGKHVRSGRLPADHGSGGGAAASGVGGGRRGVFVCVGGVCVPRRAG